MAEELYLADLLLLKDFYLKHYGVGYDDNPPGRGSGRYPHGSGENPGQHQYSFREQVKELRSNGLTDQQICDYFGIKSTEFRAMVTVGKAMDYAEERRKIMHYRDDRQMSPTAIAAKLGISETKVRNVLKGVESDRLAETIRIADALRDEVAEKNYIEVGPGVALQMGISEQKLTNIVRYLQKEEGYVVGVPRLQQAGTNGKTTMKVLAPPGTESKTFYEKDFMDKIQMVEGFVEGEGQTATLKKMHPPVNIDKSKVHIVYNEEGGVDKDGTIELRPGVPELSLGKANYAQVRIAVGGDRYLKGMAVYGDPKDFPEGCDIIFNTNKHKGTAFDAVLKEQDLANPNNPFKSSITRQNDWTDENGKEHKGALNIVKSEGDWADYSNKLPSQFLSKQPVALAKQQLELDYKAKKAELDSILALDNPVVKRELLADFADECDSDAVHLKAAALPRQGHHVILPVTSISEKEVYAPRFNDGETVVLIRFPHAGKFEIPELTVNNHNKEAERKMGKNPKDAIGINPVVAGQLSGADFDGDTVLVIPNPHVTRNKDTKKSEGAIKVDKAWDDLRKFEPKEVYATEPKYDENGKRIKTISEEHKQRMMGVVSNLITDMQIGGAPKEDLIPAVKFSMVIIDAEKHYLDYKAAYKDCEIDRLKREYQQHADDDKYGGAQTLISRAKREVRVPERKEYYLSKSTINPETGEKVFKNTGRTKKEYERDPVTKKVTKVVDTGEIVTIKSREMYEAKDARELLSGTRKGKDGYNEGTLMERTYANYANGMKELGNQARKEWLNAGRLEYDRDAAKKYSEEVASLELKLLDAKKNAPYERQAQRLVDSEVRQIKATNPDMSYADEKKLRARRIEAAREAVGAKKKRINITDEEWKAIQAGAISDNKLTQIFKNSDSDRLRELATPKSKGVSASQKARIESLLGRGYTIAQVAEYTGVSSSTIARLKDE